MWRRVVFGSITIGLLLLITAGVLVAVGWFYNPPVSLMDITTYPRDRIHIGTPVRHRLIFEGPLYRWPLEGEASAVPEGLQVVREGPWRLLGVGVGTWRWAFDVLVQPYKTGDLPGASVAVRFTGDRARDNEPLVFATPPLAVVPRHQSAIRGPLTAAPLIEYSYTKWFHSWRQWLALAILVAAIIAILISILRRHEGHLDAEAVPPWDVARQAIESLRTRLPLHAELFFVECTDILRWYIEKRFSLPAPEQTTAEFLETMRSSDHLNPEHKEQLAQALQAADMVKFARAQATEAQMEEVLSQSLDFVNETIPGRGRESDHPPGHASNTSRANVREEG